MLLALQLRQQQHLNDAAENGAENWAGGRGDYELPRTAEEQERDHHLLCGGMVLDVAAEGVEELVVVGCR